jgi:lysophospholipid acyltransferase (LPLAT)-like uncharacterized protein
LTALLRALVIRTLHASLRVRHVRVANIRTPPQSILAFWHAHLLLMLHARYKRPIVAMISQSKDGDLIASTFKHYGVSSARGSSTRGGTAALREMIRSARAGMSIAFTPDGPKGPARIAKDGVVYAARATGLPIVPIAFAAKKKSYCAPGIGWSCRFPSPARSSSTAIRSSSRATATSRSGGFALNVH